MLKKYLTGTRFADYVVWAEDDNDAIRETIYADGWISSPDEVEFVWFTGETKEVQA